MMTAFLGFKTDNSSRRAWDAGQIEAPKIGETIRQMQRTTYLSREIQEEKLPGEPVLKAGKQKLQLSNCWRLSIDRSES